MREEPAYARYEPPSITARGAAVRGLREVRPPLYALDVAAPTQGPGLLPSEAQEAPLDDDLLPDLPEDGEEDEEFDDTDYEDESDEEDEG